MSLILDGSVGVSDIDGSAATPAFRGADANTGMFFPAADTIAFSEGGVESMRLNSSGVLVTTNDASISGLTVGKGAGSNAFNTTVGSAALAGSNTGANNTAIGYGTLFSNTSGASGTAIGTSALLVNTTGSSNTAVGHQALTSNTTASFNTAVGTQAGYSNTTGSQLTAIGRMALYSNTTGTEHTAVGHGALYSNTTGNYNTAFSSGALGSNTTGSNNVAVGYDALPASTTASNNVAVGYRAGYSNTTGRANTFLGANSGYSVTTGEGNTAIGGGVAGLCNAPLQFSTGSYNIAIGGSTLQNATGNNNTGVGFAAGTGNTSGTNNTFLGATALASNTTGANNTAVGYQAGYSTTTVIRNTFIGGSAGYSTTGGTNTFVGESAGYAVTSGANHSILGRYDGNQSGLDIRTNTTGFVVLSTGSGAVLAYAANGGGWFQQNNSTAWSITSDARIKKNIEPLENGLSTILALQPKEYDYIISGQHDVGFIAQDYEAVLPLQITEQDASGEYAELTDGDKVKGIQQNLVPYLVKAIQELNAKVEAQALEIATLKGN